MVCCSTLWSRPLSSLYTAIPLPIFIILLLYFLFQNAYSWSSTTTLQHYSLSLEKIEEAISRFKPSGTNYSNVELIKIRKLLKEPSRRVSVVFRYSSQNYCNLKLSALWQLFNLLLLMNIYYCLNSAVAASNERFPRFVCIVPSKK